LLRYAFLFLFHLGSLASYQAASLRSVNDPNEIRRHQDNQIDLATGKRLWLAWHQAFGACVDPHKASNDLYNSSAEFDSWVERSIEAEGLHHPRAINLAPPSQQDESTRMFEEL
jgi:hypothetical protein